MDLLSWHLPDLKVVLCAVYDWGFRRMDEKDISYITVSGKVMRMTWLLYSFTMQKVRNCRLWILCGRHPCLGYPFANPVFVPTDMTRSLAGSSWGIWSSWQRRFWTTSGAYCSSSKSVMDRLIVNMETLIRRIPDQEQISFVWRIYNGHPQVCYDLSYRLLHEMYMGNTAIRSSAVLWKMAERFGVSVSTAQDNRYAEPDRKRRVHQRKRNPHFIHRWMQQSRFYKPVIRQPSSVRPWNCLYIPVRKCHITFWTSSWEGRNW